MKRILVLLFLLPGCVGAPAIAGDAQSNCEDYQTMVATDTARCKTRISFALDCSNVHVVFEADWTSCHNKLQSMTCAELNGAPEECSEYGF